MADVLIRGGSRFQTTTPDEMRQIIHETQVAESAAFREQARTFKWMRLPANLTGKPASSAIKLGVTQGQLPVGPEQGYAWAIRRLIVTGLTSGATPDIVNLYLNDNFGGPIQWQFNGNNFGYTFGRSEMVLMSGDTLALQNSGSIASTSTITLTGELEEVAAEMLYKVR